MTGGSYFVNVIVPVFNGERFLCGAIVSIRSQNYRLLVIIIVDDGSTDRSAALVKELGEDTRYFFQPNQGPSAARNRGLEMARGEVIALLDADDMWLQDKLKLQVRRLAEDEAMDVVLGRVQYFELFTPVELGYRFETQEKTTYGVNLWCGVFRKIVFDKVGTFDETLRNAGNNDWFMRARELGIAMVIIKQVTLHYCLHENNLHRTQPFQSQLPLVLKKAVERRRRIRLADSNLRKLIDFDKGMQP